MKIKCTLAGLVFLTSTTANALDVGVGVKAGTVGAGAELSVALTQTINARVSLTQVNYDFDETITIEDSNNSANIDANVDMDFGASALLLDWYVFDGTFHLTAGMMKNNSKIKINGTLQDNTVVFDGTSYDVSQDFEDPTIRGTVSVGESYQPYLGLGWGRKADDDPGFALSVELGVVLLDPKVDLQAPTVSQSNPHGINQADLDADVNAAESDANKELSALEAWPILSIGLNYAF
jgi:hypothetical protein